MISYKAVIVSSYVTSQCCTLFQGAGCALMGHHTRFEGIVRGMVDVLDCPLTVKMRTGIYNKNWNAHNLIPKLRAWGVSMVTVSMDRCTIITDIGWLELSVF